MENFITPGTPAYAEACDAASEILNTKVRYLAEYNHGPVAIGLLLRRGNAIEAPIRRKEGKIGVTGGYLRYEHLLDALLREHTEEEAAPGTSLPITVDDLLAWSQFVGIIDAVGHTVGAQTHLREIDVILLVTLPSALDLAFTPSPETSEKVLLTYADVLANPDRYRGDGEYKLILRAAACAAGMLTLPGLTTDPLGDGVYLNIIDTSNVVL